MKKSNIIIFVIIILVILAIFGYAIWQSNNSKNEDQNNIQYIGVDSDNRTDGNVVAENGVNLDDAVNEAQANDLNVGEENVNSTSSDNRRKYVGDWYISQESYNNAERVDELVDLREDNLITDEEFESELNTGINNNIVELEVDECSQNRIKFDFTLTSPAPTQREGKLDDVVVELTDNIGTFTYTDNWGTSGNGTITLKEDSIELKLETTSAAQGALWGVEGIYTFSYRIAD